MQTMEIISVNLWQILISLCNLLLLFLLLKKFLYKPVKKMLAQRQEAIDKDYADAAEAKKAARQDQQAWEEKMTGAKKQADAILQEAVTTADRRGRQMVEEAKDKADAIVRQAQADAQLELQKAEATVKQEIVDVSAEMTEKLLGREIKPADHRAMIDAFLDDMDAEK